MLKIVQSDVVDYYNNVLKSMPDLSTPISSLLFSKISQ